MNLTMLEVLVHFTTLQRIIDFATRREPKPALLKTEHLVRVQNAALHRLGIVSLAISKQYSSLECL